MPNEEIKGELRDKLYCVVDPDGDEILLLEQVAEEILELRQEVLLLEKEVRGLQEHNAELEKERNELAAHVERLRDKFTKANTWEDVREAFASTPQQSLNALKRGVAREAFVAGFMESCSFHNGELYPNTDGFNGYIKEYLDTKYPKEGE